MLINSFFFLIAKLKIKHSPFCLHVKTVATAQIERLEMEMFNALFIQAVKPQKYKLAHNVSCILHYVHYQSKVNNGVNKFQYFYSTRMY